MYLAWLFIIAYLADLIWGDPPDWPHPVRWMGRIIEYWEKILYRPSVGAGAFFWVAATGTVLTIMVFLIFGLEILPGFFTAPLWIYLIYTCLATRSLHVESRPVEEALERDDLAGARSRLSFIVSRDTSRLSREEMHRGAIETVAENISDGVVAPIFYASLFGVPGMILYKMVNTLDSMVGYKDERYLAFGRIAARADDWANFLPARLTAYLLVAAAFLTGQDAGNAWRILKRDHHQAASPNAGWPEAALAGALRVQLGGPSTYFGRLVKKPYIGDPDRELSLEVYRSAVRLLYVTSALMAALSFFILLAVGAGIGGLAGSCFQD